MYKHVLKKTVKKLSLFPGNSRLLEKYHFHIKKHYCCNFTDSTDRTHPTLKWLIAKEGSWLVLGEEESPAVPLKLADGPGGLFCLPGKASPLAKHVPLAGNGAPINHSVPRKEG